MIYIFLHISLEYLNSDLLASVNKSAIYIEIFFLIYRLINMSACRRTAALSFITPTQSNISQLTGKKINCGICWNIYSVY